MEPSLRKRPMLARCHRRIRVRVALYTSTNAKDGSDRAKPTVAVHAGVVAHATPPRPLPRLARLFTEQGLDLSPTHAPNGNRRATLSIQPHSQCLFRSCYKERFSALRRSCWQASRKSLFSLADCVG